MDIQIELTCPENGRFVARCKLDVPASTAMVNLSLKGITVVSLASGAHIFELEGHSVFVDEDDSCIIADVSTVEEARHLLDLLQGTCS